MWDNIFGAWLYSFENESWNVVSQEKIQCWFFSDLSRPSTWFKSKTAHFYLITFIQCFEHAECIAIDIFNLLDNAWLNAAGDVKNPQKH